MKLLEQYLYLVRKKLPLKGRDDVIKELRSLILDDIEIKYGENPEEDQIQEFLKDYGSPGKVAKQYGQQNVPISSQYTDLYFLIGKLVVLSLSIAFVVTFVVNFLIGTVESEELIWELTKIPLHIIQGSFSAFGVVTIIFILLSKYSGSDKDLLDDEWDPKELKDVVIGPEKESKASHIASLIFLPLFLILLPYFPQIIGFIEKLTETGRINIIHNLNIELFTSYLIGFGILIIIDVVYHILSLVFGSETKGIFLYKVISNLISALYLLIVTLTNSLYIGENSIIGIRLVFIVLLIITTAEFITETYKYIKFYILKR